MTDITYKCNTRNLKKILAILLDAGLVPFIVSSPGMGKSCVVKSLADDYNLKLIDHRISTSEPTDFSGLPRITDDYAKMVPFTDIFPLESTQIPQGKNGWILFLDEFNSGTKQTMAASYRPILDHQVGQHGLHFEPARVVAHIGIVVGRPGLRKAPPRLDEHAQVARGQPEGRVHPVP